MSYGSGEHCTKCGKFVDYEDIRWDRDIRDTGKGVPYCVDCWRKLDLDEPLMGGNECTRLASSNRNNDIQVWDLRSAKSEAC
jgi:DNA-directed RNA polymerase subunit RPC12/RpoP